MRLITISGAKNTNKELVASRLAQNSDCIWIRPYTDGLVHEYDAIRMNDKQLSAKMEREVPLAMTEVNGKKYVFFETQLRASYCVIIADDRIVTYLKNNWEGDLLTIKCHSKDEEYSERALLPDRDYDIIFNTDNDDYDELEELVGDHYFYREETV